MTSHAANSRWVKDESSYAIDLENKKEIRLITLDVAEGKLPPMWRVRQHIPFRQDYDDGLRQLLAALRTKRPAALPIVTPVKPPPSSSRIPGWVPILIGLAFVLLAVFLTRSLLLSVEDEEPPQVGMAVGSSETATSPQTTVVTVIHSPTLGPETPATFTPPPTVTPNPTIEPTRIDPTVEIINPTITIAVTVVAPTNPPPTIAIPPTSTITPIPTETPTATVTSTPTVTSSFPEIAGEPPSSDFKEVIDDANAISVEVPVEWTVDGSNWIGDDGRVMGSELVASTNIDDFMRGYTTPGVQILGSAEWGGQDINTLLDRWDFSGECTLDMDSREDNYEHPLFSGIYDWYYECADLDTIIIVLAVKPADSSYALVLLIQAVSDTDLEMVQRVLDTYKVVGPLPGQ